MVSYPAVTVLKLVAGLAARRNDIVFKRGTLPSQGSIVFFPGDVQDLEEIQSEHRDNRRYLEWSLENTTLILSKAFEKKNIFTIRPSRKSYQTFSCYDNFVESDAVGCPTHSPDCGAVNHLTSLLQNSAHTLGIEGDVLSNVTLIGFSKGVVVLNQIVHELATLAENSSGINNQSGLKFNRFVWLDGGHNGGKDIWITDRSVIHSFSLWRVAVAVRVTPYQIHHSRRPWIKEEEKKFRRLLQECHVEVDRRLLFEDRDPSIELHFQVIKSVASIDC